MTLTALTYLILEGIRANEIVDDEKISLRLIQDWVIMKRADFLRQQGSGNRNPNKMIDLNNYQKLDLTVATADSYTGTFDDYPFDNTADPDRQLKQIVVSNETIPSILEGKQGPMIWGLESTDLMKLPFSVVSYDYMRFAGNGKFNTSLIYGSLRDNKIYFKYNSYFDTNEDVVLRAIFADPRDVTGYDVGTDEFPVSPSLLEAIKTAAFEKDFKALLAGRDDNVNDASGDIYSN